MTKLLVAVIGVLVIATGVLGVVLWDMKSRDAGLTAQLTKDKWVESGYEVRMAQDGEIKDSGTGGKLIPLVFTVIRNGSVADGLTVRVSVLRKSPPSYPPPSGDWLGEIKGRYPNPYPDRRITLTGTPTTDSKGRVRATLFLPSDGPGSIIPITVSVYMGSTKLGESTKTIRLE